MLEHLQLIGSGLVTIGVLFLALVAGMTLMRAYASVRGHSLNGSFFDDDNSAVVVRTASFVVSLVLAVMFAYHPDASFAVSSKHAVFAILLSVIALAVSFLVNDYVIVRKIDNTHAVFEDRNLAVAIIESATFLATALIFAGGIQDQSHSLVFNLVWFGIGQAFLVALAFLYSFVAPNIFNKAIEGKAACALSIAGFLVSGGIVVGAAIKGEFHGWISDFFSVGQVVGVWLIVMALARVFVHMFIVNSTRLSTELCDDNNWALGFVDGAISVVFTVALVATYVS